MGKEFEEGERQRREGGRRGGVGWAGGLLHLKFETVAFLLRPCKICICGHGTSAVTCHGIVARLQVASLRRIGFASHA